MKTSCASSKPAPRFGLRLSDSLFALPIRNRVTKWYNSYTISDPNRRNNVGTGGKRQPAERRGGGRNGAQFSRGTGGCSRRRRRHWGTDGSVHAALRGSMLSLGTVGALGRSRQSPRFRRVEAERRAASLRSTGWRGRGDALAGVGWRAERKIGPLVLAHFPSRYYD